MKNKTLKIMMTGLVAGLVSESILGILFTNRFTHSLLYNPEIQSPKFIEVTSNRMVSLPPTIAGLVILTIIHAWLFAVLQRSIPGAGWIKKGIFWGLTIWLMYWVFQEWFIFRTLLGEPTPLVFFELSLLLIGSLVEGLITSKLLYERR